MILLLIDGAPGIRILAIFFNAQCAHHAQCSAEDGCIRRIMSRAFIGYVYCKGFLHSAGQERVLDDSAPSPASPPNSPNDHSSTTN